MENSGTMQQSEVVLSPLERRLKQNKSWSNLLPQETMDRMKKQMKNYSFLVSDRVSKESNQRNTCSSNREMIPPFNSMNNQFQFNSSPEKKELLDASPRVNQLIEQFRSQLVNKSSLHQLNQQIHDQVVHTLFEPPVSGNIRSEEVVSSVPNTNTNVLRNSAIPMVTVFLPMFMGTATGSIFVEAMFRIPGLGSYFVSSLENRDYPLEMALDVQCNQVLVFDHEYARRRHQPGVERRDNFVWFCE